MSLGHYGDRYGFLGRGLVSEVLRGTGRSSSVGGLVFGALVFGALRGTGMGSLGRG